MKEIDLAEHGIRPKDLVYDSILLYGFNDTTTVLVSFDGLECTYFAFVSRPVDVVLADAQALKDKRYPSGSRAAPFIDDLHPDFAVNVTCYVYGLTRVNRDKWTNVNIDDIVKPEFAATLERTKSYGIESADQIARLMGYDSLADMLDDQ